MKYFWIYCLFLITIILFFSYYNSTMIEGMKNKVETIVLLGDSIFQNNNYVPPNHSIEDLLNDTIPIQSIVLAEDNATIYNIIQQYNKMPIVLNNSTTYMYISIGGNDLLNFYENNDVNDLTSFNMIWNLYRSTILQLSKNTLCTIILTDIYFITDPNYSKYLPIIKKWNTNLYQFAKKHNFKVFKISEILTQPQDYTNSIEPSSIGGEKMVNSFIY